MEEALQQQARAWAELVTGDIDFVKEGGTSVWASLRLISVEDEPMRCHMACKTPGPGTISDGSHELEDDLSTSVCECMSRHTARRIPTREPADKAVTSSRSS